MLRTKALGNRCGARVWRAPNTLEKQPKGTHMMTKRMMMIGAGAAMAMGLAGVPGMIGGAAPVVATTSAMASPFQVDQAHSSVIFRILHKGVSFNTGRFNEMSGTFHFDADDLDSSSLKMSIKSESVDTNNAGRDRHLRNADFFDAKQFPSITFQSSSVSHVGGSDFEVTGKLTLLGVSKEITAKVTNTGVASTSKGELGGIESVFTIKRSDFGMNTYIKEGVLGDEVRLQVNLEGGR